MQAAHKIVIERQKAAAKAEYAILLAES